MTKSELYAILRNDLGMFVQRSFQTLNPGQTYHHNWHIDAMCYQLMRCYLGENTRLIITVPPRSLKSICTTVAFVSWLLGRDPTRSVITASYSSELSKLHANDCRRIMNETWYQHTFPGTKISDSKNTESQFRTTLNGGRFSTSVGGTITGFGADFIIIDDPLKADDDPSETTLNNTNAWYKSSVITRLNDQNTGCIIIVMQRLHENDLAGSRLQTGDWYHLNLPAIAEVHESIPISADTVFARAPGDLLHKKRLSRDRLLQLEAELGSYRFAAQYQQNPAPAGGGIIKWDWMQYYDGTFKFKKPGEYIIQSWDTANSIKEHASYSVCATFLWRDDQYYLLHLLRERFEFPELETSLLMLSKKWSSDLVLIEQNGCSLPIIQSVQRKHPNINLKALSPVSDKPTRMQAETPAIAAGKLLLPKQAPWMEAFKRELLLFPNGNHDDQVDSLSQFLYWARLYGPLHPNSGLRKGKIYLF